jgi:hypothetical protein
MSVEEVIRIVLDVRIIVRFGNLGNASRPLCPMLSSTSRKRKHASPRNVLTREKPYGLASSRSVRCLSVASQASSASANVSKGEPAIMIAELFL